jgi:single-stranded-DNA-specific exonuclease
MQHSFTTTASGLPWRLRHEDHRTVTAMAQQQGMSELLASVLVGRGVTLDDVQQFLNPTLRDALPDPFHLLDMDKAVARILTALERGERITVFGDYDVDGATSTALLMQYFSALGVALIPYIPDRMMEGYGPTIEGFKKIIAQGATLIITVDCGTLAHAPIAFAKEQGVDVIVLDHHLSSGALPDALAVVNPNRADEASPHRNIAAVGVTFLLLVALNKTLRNNGFFAQQKEPSLLSLLDIVALGTVCDVMPLTGLNRAFVAQGLKVMAGRTNLGLSVLADVARLNELPNVYHLGFLLGPRINAGGRVGKSSLGVELLTAEDADAARGIAQQLDLHNSERQAIEADVSAAAFSAAELQQNMPVILVAGEGWHPGVIGIVAGRLKEKFSRPAMVVSLDAGSGKASGRSVTGVDMGAAIHAAIAEGLIASGGGHAMAAGFSVTAEQIPALHDFFIRRMEAAVAAYNEARVLKFDGTLSVGGANLDTLDDIARAGPYGLGNPSPRFILSRATILHRSVMKEKHLKLVVGDASGTTRLNAVAFGAVGSVLGEWLMGERELHLLGELKRNVWQGNESAQFMIDDAALV